MLFGSALSLTNLAHFSSYISLRSFARFGMAFSLYNPVHMCPFLSLNAQIRSLSVYPIDAWLNSSGFSVFKVSDRFCACGFLTVISVVCQNLIRSTCVITLQL